jgi:hypothetical protein
MYYSGTRRQRATTGAKVASSRCRPARQVLYIYPQVYIMYVLPQYTCPGIMYYDIPSKHLLNEAFSNIIHKRVYLAKRSTAKSKCKLQKGP